VGAMRFMEQTAVEWGPMMAAGVIICTPVLLVFIFLSKYLVKGLSAGAVKG